LTTRAATALALIACFGCEPPNHDGAASARATNHADAAAPSAATTKPEGPPAATPPREDAMKPKDSPAATPAPASKPLGHAPSQKEALDVFKQLWHAEMMKPGGPPGAAQVDGLVRSGTPQVKRIPLRDYRAFVADRIGTREPNAAILLGSLRALDRDGACWEIHYDGMLGGGLDACVDAADGRVLFIWRTPEG